MTTCYHPEEKLAFIHIPKCAGSAIGGRFRSDKSEWFGCWLDKVIPGWTRDGLPNGHQPVATLQHFLGIPIDQWKQVLVTIRNPFEQQVSQYCFWRDRGRRHSNMKLPGYHQDDRFAASATFEQVLADPRSNGPNACCGDRWRESGGVYRWWCAVDGVIPDNVTIIRMEDLPHALHDALGRGNGVELEWVNSFPRENSWQDWYNEESAAIIKEKFSWSLAVYYPELTSFCGSGTMNAAERGAELPMFG